MSQEPRFLTVSAAHNSKVGAVNFYKDASFLIRFVQPANQDKNHASWRRGSIDHTMAKKNEHFTHLYLPLSSRFCAVNRRVILCLSDESTWKQSCVTIILKQQFSSRKDLITGLCKLKEVTRWPEKSATKAARERASRDIRVTSPPNHLPTNEFATKKYVSSYLVKGQVSKKNSFTLNLQSNLRR